jgi:hypothetical protein
VNRQTFFAAFAVADAVKGVFLAKMTKFSWAAAGPNWRVRVPTLTVAGIAFENHIIFLKRRTSAKWTLFALPRFTIARHVCPPMPPIRPRYHLFPKAAT